MNLGSVSQIGIAAIQKGLTKLDQATDAIAKISVNSDENDVGSGRTPDLVQSLVSLKEAKLEVQAAVKIVGIYDEILGTLLDVKA